MTRGRRLQKSSGERFLWCLGHQIRRQIRIRHDCSTPAALFGTTFNAGGERVLAREERERGNSSRSPGEREFEPNNSKQSIKLAKNQSNRTSQRKAIHESRNPKTQRVVVRACRRVFVEGSRRKKPKRREKQNCARTGRRFVRLFLHPQTATL